MEKFEALGTGVVVIIAVLALVVVALPVFFADWKRAPEISTLVLVVALGSGFFAANTAPLVRDLLFATGWIGASILSALSRILGVLVERRSSPETDSN
ncbi:hypothetical protein [Breoghania sp. JC706]|uniref:hypothetical protein n=1 Tax=Breoghania sp. JC706 TaxID=3117732 RepID=UPI00300A0140